ncbi:unnamed protein product [Rotaria sp. Silwood1]|nr:unnamed protein product [Rotaria sp. Silwood1]CAF1634386.1 unnamed protein product [Rotaria sp. Silwood1]CAF3745703.1 unnamed protein product [Rotaria sp. Silwood1]CAF3750617.1 unnamed protein product [Rotaria sp. Silwood1]CAF3796517.1 unnamed protein product [Rotaria sp. Silwood1]
MSMIKLFKTLKTAFVIVHPLRGNAIDIHPNARWEQQGVIVAGGNGQGHDTDLLHTPMGLFVDDEQTIYVADYSNHRIMEWKRGATNGQVVAGGNGQGRTVVASGNRRGDHLDQLNLPLYVFVDQAQSVYVSDTENYRVMKWMKGATQGIVVAGSQGQGSSLTQFSYP